MEERRWDDTGQLTDKADLNNLFDAFLKPQNKMVALHKPGSRVKMPDGKEYVLSETGEWKRVEVEAPLIIPPTEKAKPIG